MRSRSQISPAAAILAVLFVALAGAAEAQQTFARSYSVTPKAGMTAQFETALKAHVEWRAENGDPWTWSVWSVETGENLGDYLIRSSGHSWADFDAYDAGFGPQGLVHWRATVAPLVESVSSSISTTIESLSRPMPEGTQVAFVTITDFYLRPAYGDEFIEAITSATEILNEHDFGGYGVWSSSVTGGGPGPRVSLVSLYSSWADMAEPDPSFEAIMTQALGEDGLEEWGDQIGQTYRGIETYTLRYRPDLGVNDN